MSDGSRFGKHVKKFRIDNSSFLHAGNRKKDILILGKALSDGLDDTALTTEAEYSISFSEKQQNYLSLHYNGSNNFLLVNRIKIYKFKAKDSELNAYPLCTSNISTGCTVENMKNLVFRDTRMIFQLIMLMIF